MTSGTVGVARGVGMETGGGRGTDSGSTAAGIPDTGVVVGSGGEGYGDGDGIDGSSPGGELGGGRSGVGVRVTTGCAARPSTAGETSDAVRGAGAPKYVAGVVPAGGSGAVSSSVRSPGELGMTTRVPIGGVCSAVARREESGPEGGGESPDTGPE